MELPDAARELEWLIAHSASAMGLHAQAIDPDRTTAFDPETAHLAKLTRRHREAVEREGRVRAVFGRMWPPNQATVTLAFTPHNYVGGLRVAFRVGRSNACLAALASVTPEAIRAREAEDEAALRRWRKKCVEWQAKLADGPAEPAPTMPRRSETVLAYLGRLVGDDGRQNQKTVQPIAVAATALLNAALAEYDALRLERDAALGLTREVG